MKANEDTALRLMASYGQPCTSEPVFLGRHCLGQMLGLFFTANLRRFLTSDMTVLE